jgi:hypothetical protein
MGFAEDSVVGTVLLESLILKKIVHLLEGKSYFSWTVNTDHIGHPTFRQFYVIKFKYSVPVLEEPLFRSFSSFFIVIIRFVFL